MIPNTSIYILYASGDSMSDQNILLSTTYTIIARSAGNKKKPNNILQGKDVLHTPDVFINDGVTTNAYHEHISNYNSRKKLY